MKIKKNKPLVLKKTARKGKQANFLEKRFKMILALIGLKENVDYKFQYELDGKLFDFYLIKSGILIEVDGDFFHCNENKYSLKYDIQRATILNDQKKNKICIDKEKKLYRFWEDDINNRPEWVIVKLKKILSI